MRDRNKPLRDSLRAIVGVLMFGASLLGTFLALHIKTFNSPSAMIVAVGMFSLASVMSLVMINGK